MTTPLYKLTPEHEALLPSWRDRWIANAMSTAAMTEADRASATEAVYGLYEAAGLKRPRVVFVASPFVGRFAAGFAAAIWHARKNGMPATDAATIAATFEATDEATYAATRAATYAATRAATIAAIFAATDEATYAAAYAATRAATYAATRAATDKATDAATIAAIDEATYVATRAAIRTATIAAIDKATYVATRAATRAAIDKTTYEATNVATYEATFAATYAAIFAATDEATNAATYAATDAAIDEATKATNANHNFDVTTMIALANDLGLGRFGLMCAQEAWKFTQGGNQWSAWDSYITFFKDVARLPLDYSKYQHWQTLSERSGPRFAHEEFCIISDRPAVLKVDDQNRPHREDGPFCQWRDGTGIYAWHGIKVPARWLSGHKPTAAEAMTWENIEQRRAACEIVGWAAILDQLEATVIDADGDPEIGTLLQVNLPGIGKEKFLKVTCGTGRVFALPAPPDMKTALQANAWTWGLEANEYQPEVRT